MTFTTIAIFLKNLSILQEELFWNIFQKYKYKRNYNMCLYLQELHYNIPKCSRYKPDKNTYAYD